VHFLVFDYLLLLHRKRWLTGASGGRENGSHRRKWVMAKNEPRFIEEACWI